MATTSLNADPSRTTVMRRRMVGEMNKRFRNMKGAINDLIIKDDAFGLAEPVLFTKTLQKATRKRLIINIEPQVWRFKTDKGKIDAFRAWLTGEINAKILSIDSATGKPWTDGFIESAHQKGVVRGFTQVKNGVFDAPSDLIDGTQRDFLNQAFTDRIAVGKIERLAIRTFNELKDVTDTMAGKMSRILSDGLANGNGARVIAAKLNKEIDGLTKARARVIARTEIVSAHAEGQLDAFEKLGIEEVGIFVEWLTAGDDKVCGMCASLEGVILTIKEARGLIPRHPNCRCAYIPADSRLKVKGQLWSKTKINKAIDDSVKFEAPKGTTIKAARRRSVWAGSDKIPKNKGKFSKKKTRK